MAPSATSTTFASYRKAVSRFSPNDLLPILARVSAAAEPEHMAGRSDFVHNAPWAYAGLARDSLLFGNLESRDVPTANSVARLYQRYSNVVEFRRTTDLGETVTPIAYEQFPFQETGSNEMARVSALMGQRAGHTSWDWEGVLGLPLESAMRASILLHMWIVTNGGRYDPAFFDVDDFQEGFETIAPRDHIESLVKYFTTTVAEVRASAPDVLSANATKGKYAPNPLSTKPLIDLGDHGIWAPVAAMIPRALSVASLYDVGNAKWRRPFTRDLGHRTESYVGDQLRQIAGDQLRSEIKWEKNQNASIDWIWVHPKTVILIESKSARLSVLGRSNSMEMRDSSAKYIAKGRQQIDETADLIASRQHEFINIPNDRPVIGIVLTSEPFYLANSTLWQFGPPSKTPSIVVSLRELEQLVCYPREAMVAHLLHLVLETKERSWSISSTFKDLPAPSRNVILDKAFARYRFGPAPAELS
jgi:hypothetical protein